MKIDRRREDGASNRSAIQPLTRMRRRGWAWLDGNFMESGTTPSASAIVGTAVLRIVVSSASIRNATATIHGSVRLTEGSTWSVTGAGSSRSPARRPR